MTKQAMTPAVEKKQKQLDDNGGMAGFCILRDGDRTVDATLRDGKHGLVWLLSDDEATRYGRKFVPHDSSWIERREEEREPRSRVQEQLGLHEALEIVPARVHVEETFTGGYLGGIRELDVMLIREESVDYGAFRGTPYIDAAKQEHVIR